ncbi:hypothetical protein ACLB2K_064277 [Fragaria x ananassa]
MVTVLGLMEKRVCRPTLSIPLLAILKSQNVVSRNHISILLHADGSSSAAEEMNVSSVTTLKKRCRELRIKRWPNRKLNSLKNLEKCIQEFGKNEEELELLEKERKLVEEVPDLQLEEKTKRLRQAYLYKAKSCSRSKTASA